jgi:hypothetical protein
VGQQRSAEIQFAIHSNFQPPFQMLRNDFAENQLFSKVLGAGGKPSFPARRQQQ